jgi:hypothetical protein
MKKLEISEETYDKIKDQLEEKTSDEMYDISDMVGNKYFFRTVTYHIIGKVVRILSEQEVYTSSIVLLKDASWVADSGRFMDAIKKGTLSEVEPLGTWFVNLETVTDFGPWNHPLPKEQK